jgi:hypothetical protein
MLTNILTAFYVVWLCAVLALLWLIWRNGVKYRNRVENALIDSTLKAASAAKDAAEAARALAHIQE